MGIFNKPKKGGMADVIRCDESDYLVWKWHPNKYDKGQLKRETAIRTNSILRVKTGETAIFVYKQKDGTLEDYIEGPFEDKIKTKNFPILSSIIGLWYEGDTPFQAEVFFVNTAKAQQIKFGIPYFNIVDPRYVDYDVPVAVRGSITFGINDVKSFVKKHQLVNFSLDDLKKKVNDAVIMHVKNAVVNAPAKYAVPVINIESKINNIKETSELELKDKLLDVFGIDLHSLDINAIEVDKDTEAYQELKNITKTIKQREIEANILNYEEQLRIQREEGQYAQHMATKQTNLGAYQTEVTETVGVAGAEALGKMGENGAGNVDMGGNAGFNPMTMMAGIAVGSAVGQNISGTLNKSINPTAGPSVPPPLPVTKYYVAKDGKPTGPFTIDELKSMISTGEFNFESLVWKEGMEKWEKASSQTDLISLFPPKL